MLLLATLASTSGRSVADSCPYNWLKVTGGPPDSSTAISRSLGLAEYDWRTGFVRSQSYAGSADHELSASEVRAQDDFMVEGPPDGTPLLVRVRLVVGASVNTSPQTYSYAFARASLAAPGMPPLEIWLSGGLGLDTFIRETRDLDVPVIVGQVFRLRLGALSQAVDAFGSVEATLSFVDLTPGSIVRSCQGLTFGGGVVPSRRTTWSALKSHYR